MSIKISIIVLFLICVPSLGGAYETDQFNNRQQPIEDSTSVMDRQVTLAIANTITGLHGPRNEMKVVNGIYHKIGGRHWVDKLEIFAMNSSEIERLDTPPHESIYAGHPMYATRVAGFFGVGPTLKINEVLIGTDKLGHFLSQGRKFFKRWLKMGDEAKAAKHSAYTERAIFGQLTTGSYSNADLVANYEGYRFYRSLFEDNFLNGKPAILAWKNSRWNMQRPFEWSDHVNDYWDEALNISHYDSMLYSHMKTRLMTFCDDYRESPGSYIVHNEEDLKYRYRDLQLRDSSELRLNNLCANEQNNSVSASMTAPRDPEMP